MENKQLPFWIFTFSVFLALLLPTLLMEGMFFDGLVNSSIARNLAAGDGEFWSLHYSKVFNFPFSDQLPLTFWIQGLFFRLFGDHLYVERIYSLLSAIISGICIVKIWKYIYKDNTDFSKLAWIPFLFWIITPVVFWSFSNNMLENTVTIFDLAAIYQLMKALANDKLYLRLSFAGLLILAATLSKGPIGLYPLSTILIYRFSFKNISITKAIWLTVFIILIISIVLAVIFNFEEKAFQSISNYLNQQVFKSIEGKRENASGRFFIVGRLIGELIPIIILSILIFIIGKNKSVKMTMNDNNKKLFLTFLLLAFSASLPITISLKQSGYYLVPSFSIFAIAAGILTVPLIYQLTNRINASRRGYNMAKGITIFMFISVLFYSFFQNGKTSRDKDVVMGIYEIGNIVPRGTSISFCHDLYEDWKLHAYLMRYFYISLDENSQHDFYLTNKSCKNDISNAFIKVETENNLYEIYRRK